MKRTPKRNLISGHGSLYQYYQPIYPGPNNSCEQGTQTDEKNLCRNASSRETEMMSAIISKLYAKIISLKKQLNEGDQNPSSSFSSNLDPDVSADLAMIQPYSNHNNNNTKNPIKRNLSSSNAADSIMVDTDESDDDEWKPDDYQQEDYNKNPGRRNLTSSNAPDSIIVDTDESDDEEWKLDDYQHSKQMTEQMLIHKFTEMVPIGEGYASVPAKVLKQIDWSSYGKATRTLLCAVFSKRVLSTHSLSGRPFPNKPVKNKLEPRLVNDIVQTVVERCGVSERAVRCTISLKCKEEGKSALARRKSKEKEYSKMDQENVALSPSDVEESSEYNY